MHNLPADLLEVFFGFVVSKHFQKRRKKKPRVGTERVDGQEITKVAVSDCALTERCSFLSNVRNALIIE